MAQNGGGEKGAGRGFVGGAVGGYAVRTVVLPRPRVSAVLAVLALAACFDSDQKTVAAGTGGTTAAQTGYTPPDPWTTGQGASSSTGPKPVPESTCRDAIECVFGCAAGLPMPLPPEPDLSCFLDCDKGLDEEEALQLLRLVDCVAQQCAEKGFCDMGGSTGTGGDTGTGGGSGGTIDPCTNCILVNVQDPQPAGCVEEAEACD